MDIPVTHSVVSHPLSADHDALRPPRTGQAERRRRLVLTVLAVVVLVAAVLVFGLDGLIPFGLLLAFSADSDEEGSRRSVALTPRNLGLAAVMSAAFAWFWLWHLDLTESTLVLVGGALIALPLALQDSGDDRARDRTIAVTKRSLILAIWGLVVFVYLYYAYGQSFNMLAAVCLVLPLVLAASRVWGARRGRIEFGLLRHPLRREVRPHLVQALNIWLCCGLLGGVVAAGGTHYARIGFSLDDTQFDVVIAAFAAGLVLLAALAVVPRRRVYVATNVVVALLSGFLAVQLAQVSDSPADAVVLDSPLAGEWFVLNGGRSVLLNGHSPNESNAVDFLRLGENGRTHTGGSSAPLTDYAGFGWPVLAPADGRIVEVTDGYADNPPGTNSDHANHLVIDIGGGLFVSMAHLQAGQRHGPCGRCRTSRSAARRGREQRPLQRAAPAPAGPGHRGQRGRRPYLPDGVPQRRHHQGRCLAVGRQPRAPHRRPRPGTRAMTTTTSNLTGAAVPGGRRSCWRWRSPSLLVAACSSNSTDPADPPARAGDLYQVDGETAHLQCQGAGSPTVVFLGGMGFTTTTWAELRAALGPEVRTCAWDYPGVGHSTGAPMMTADRAASSLHGTLRAADVPRPVILVGHSIAGLTTRLYVGEHPAAVAGVVLFDPTVASFARMFDDKEFRPEWDGTTSASQVEQVTTWPDIPFEILLHDPAVYAAGKIWSDDRGGPVGRRRGRVRHARPAGHRPGRAGLWAQRPPGRPSCLGRCRPSGAGRSGQEQRIAAGESVG